MTLLQQKLCHINSKGSVPQNKNKKWKKNGLQARLPNSIKNEGGWINLTVHWNVTPVVWEFIDDLIHSLLTEVLRHDMVPPNVPFPSHPDVTKSNYFLITTNIVLDRCFLKKCINSYPSGVPYFWSTLRSKSILKLVVS